MKVISQQLVVLFIIPLMVPFDCSFSLFFFEQFFLMYIQAVLVADYK